MPKLRQRMSGRPKPGKRVSRVLFLFGIFLFTPGILLSALRPNVTVRTRFLRMRGHAKRK
jgi:hypothetical protein